MSDKDKCELCGSNNILKSLSRWDRCKDCGGIKSGAGWYAEAPRPDDSLGSGELAGCTFSGFAEKCPWFLDEGTWHGCAAVSREAGITAGYCQEDNCGLFYMLKIAKQ